jgi:hypothetical protein
MQNVIDAEAFLEGGDKDHTTSLLGDEYANNLRAREDFESQKQQLQVQLLLACAPPLHPTAFTRLHTCLGHSQTVHMAPLYCK